MGSVRQGHTSAAAASIPGTSSNSDLSLGASSDTFTFSISLLTLLIYQLSFAILSRNLQVFALLSSVIGFPQTKQLPLRCAGILAKFICTLSSLLLLSLITIPKLILFCALIAQIILNK